MEKRSYPMDTIPLGATGSFTFQVEQEHLASNVKDSLLPSVLATPIMIVAMENASFNAIRDYLKPGESAVGIEVDIRHLAVTPVGQRVTANSKLTDVYGRRLIFAVTAHDEIEEIGRGTHQRMVVDLLGLEQRLAAKIARIWEK